MIRKRFTLIEIIAVIAVLGILAAIIIPNISDKKQTAMVTQVNANIRSLQTAMDMYSLDHHGEYASIIQPTMEEPQIINLDLLYPRYLKSLPQKVLNEYYWVDFMGKIWGASIDSPTNILKTETSTEWITRPDVESYHVYLVENVDTLSTTNRSKVKMKQTVLNHKEIDRFVSKTDEQLLISAVDKHGLETAPVGMSYRGIPEDWFEPIIKKEGTFTFEITADELMYWDGFYKKEDKPEGTDIIYEFSIKDMNSTYTTFTEDEDFYSLEPSKAIQIKITMIGHNGKLPSLLDFRLYYHFEYEKQLYKNIEQIILDDKVIDQIQLEENQEILEINFPDEEIKTIIGYEFSSNGKDFIKVNSLNDIPKEKGVLNIIRENKNQDGNSNLSLRKPVVKISEKPLKVHDISKTYVPNKEDNTTPTDPIIKEKGWETIQELVFVSSAADGQIAHWINAEISDKQPENTRILYRYATGNGFGWSSFTDDFSKLRDSKMLKVFAVLQVKEEFINQNEFPEVISIKINSSKGLLNLNTVKPTGVIKVEKNNNDERDIISIASQINWSYEGYDPQGKKIIEAIWGGDKRDNYNTPGMYTVTLKLKNEQNYWSDEIKYTFEVKDEKPVAVIGPTDKNAFYVKDPVLLDSSKSYDPDGDRIVKAEWGGDYKENGFYTLGDHTVTLRVQDEDGNWSDWSSKTFSVINSIFYNIDVAALDNDRTTFVKVSKDKQGKVYWIGDMSNRAIKIDYSNPRNSDTTSLKIQFFNDNNEIIPAQSDTVNDKLNEITVTGIVNIPEGATYFMLYNLSTNNSYAPSIYDISHFENDMNPNPVSNITSIPDHTSITLYWDNPTDEDFNKVAIYRNGIFIGYSSTGIYKDTPLQMNTEYTYTIQTIDNNYNRGKEYVEHIAKTTLGEIQWISDYPELFDGDRATFIRANTNTRRKISWIGNMSNRAIKIDYANQRSTDDCALRIQFYNDNNEIIPAQSDTVNDKSNDIIVNRIVNIPEGATYFMLYNLSTSNSYNPYIYDISYFEYDTLPNPVSNITSSFDHVSITLKWDNPKDSDFNKVAIYRNNVFVGYSSTGTYKDTLLQNNTEYTYTIQTIDNNYNRGKEYVLHKSKTQNVGEIEWISDCPELFDGDTSTYVRTYTSLRRRVSWIGDMSNRAIKIVYGNVRSSSALRIQFYNDNNEIIPMQTDTMNDKVDELIITGISGVVNIPNGATYFVLYNLETSISSAAYIYEIQYFENDSTPNPVKNVTSTSYIGDMKLNWDNPTDTDFNKVAIYRNGIFIGYSTTNTYIDTLLQANTEYTYTIQTIDNNNNRGKEYVVHKAKTLRNLEDNFTKINLSGGVNTSAVYTAPNGVVVTSNASNYINGSAYYLAYLFDGKNIYNDGSTYWLTNSTGNRFLTVDFLNERNIKGIAIEPKSREDATSNFRIFASNDNSNWTQLTDWYNTSRETANNTKVQYLLDVSYRYYRLELTRNENWGVCLGELTFYE